MESRSVHFPRIAAELDRGWTATETTTFESPNGVTIRVDVSGAPEDLDLDSLIESRVAPLRDELAEFQELESSDDAVFAGLPAVERRFSFVSDETQWHGRFVMAVDGDRIVAAGVMSTPSPDVRGDLDDEISRALAGVRLLTRPLAITSRAGDSTVGADAAMTDAARPPDPQVIDPGAWRELRSQWSTPGAPPDQPATTRWSTEELAVCAASVGAASFPTIGAEVLAGLAESTQFAVYRAVMHSFLAREHAHLDQGEIRLDPTVRATTDFAVSPQLSVAAERVDGSHDSAWWWGVDLDRALQIELSDSATRELQWISPGSLIDRLLSVTGHGAGTAAAESRSVLLAEVREPSGPLASFSTVHMAWRRDSAAVGGVVAWGVDHDGGLSLAELDDAQQSWRLTPADLTDVRAELLAHLPGV